MILAEGQKFRCEYGQFRLIAIRLPIKRLVLERDYGPPEAGLPELKEAVEILIDGAAGPGTPGVFRCAVTELRELQGVRFVWVDWYVVGPVVAFKGNVEAKTGDANAPSDPIAADGPLSGENAGAGR